MDTVEGARKIRVFDLLSKSFGTAFSNELFFSWRFLKDALLYFILMQLVAFCVNFLATMLGLILKVDSRAFGGDFLMAVTLVVLLAAYAVRVQRFALLNETPTGSFPFNPFESERTQTFTLYFVLLSTPPIMSRMLWSGQISLGDIPNPQLISFGGNILLTMVFVRLMLIFPAVALDQSFSFARSIKETRGYWLKLFLVSYIVAWLDFILFGRVIELGVAVSQGSLLILVLVDAIRAVGALVTVTIVAGYAAHTFKELGLVAPLKATR